MGTIAPERAALAGWCIIDGSHYSVVETLVSALKAGETSVAVVGSMQSLVCQKIHQALDEVDSFQLILRPGMKEGNFASKLKAHKSNFYAKPDALVLEGFEGWEDARAREVAEWAAKHPVPLIVAVAEESLERLEILSVAKK